MKSTIPQGPWYNPFLDEGIYDAKIVNLIQGTYGTDRNPYLQVVMYLAGPGCHFVTNLYLPRNKPDNKTVQRLARLCEIVGLVPQDALDYPEHFERRELKLKIGVFQKQDGHEYRDVELFLDTESVTA